VRFEEESPLEACRAFAALHGFIKEEDVHELAELIYPRVIAAIRNFYSLLGGAPPPGQLKEVGETLQDQLKQQQQLQQLQREELDQVRLKSLELAGEKEMLQTKMSEVEGALSNALNRVLELEGELKREKDGRAADIKNAAAERAFLLQNAERQLSLGKEVAEAEKARLSELLARKEAWERIVSPPLSMDPPPLSSTIISSSTNNLWGTSSQSRSNLGVTAAAFQEAQRAWANEKRDLLAAANRDKAALGEENRRLRALQLSSISTDAGASTILKEREAKGALQVEVTSLRAALTRAESQARLATEKAALATSAWEADKGRLQGHVNTLLYAKRL